MSKGKINLLKYLNILLINILLFEIVKQDNSLYEFPIEIFGQNYLPLIPLYFDDYLTIPKLMLLDININTSWVFKLESPDNNNDDKGIIKHDFYTLLGNKNKRTIYLNSGTEINEFSYYTVNQIKGKNIYPSVLSLNKEMNEYNIANKLKYEDNNIINDKYFGFCLDFTNRKNNYAKLFIGNLFNLNNHISDLIRLSLFEDRDESKQQKDDKEEIKYLKWSIKLNSLFIGPINKTLTQNITIEDENKKSKLIYFINKIYNKGLIIDESANIETIYNSIYVTKEAMLFLIANYFKDKERICFRQDDNKDENNYEIKYHCLKSEKNKLNNINLVLENNITLQLTSEDLLNCVINHNINKEEKSETCEFNIKYHQKIDHYVLGLSVFRKYKTYFLFNDNSILLEGDEFLNCYLKEDKFSNISRTKKRTVGQTIKELFNTTICISFIFGLLAGIFYIYEKIFGKIEYKKEESEKIINRDKYANL